jgi:hypothetical protein
LVEKATNRLVEKIEEVGVCEKATNRLVEKIEEVDV